MLFAFYIYEKKPQDCYKANVAIMIVDESNIFLSMNCCTIPNFIFIITLNESAKKDCDLYSLKFTDSNSTQLFDNFTSQLTLI